MASKRKKYWGNTPKFKQQRTAIPNSSNRYASLSDLDDNENASSENGVNEFVVLVPPIVVDNSHNFASVIKLLGSNAKYKRMSVGTKVMPNTLTDFELMTGKLKQSDIKFHTHPVKDPKRFKLILFGLPQISTTTIFEEFKIVSILSLSI